MTYYKMSNTILLQTMDMQKAKEHFQSKGMVCVRESEESVEMFDGDVKLIIAKGDELGPIMELLVPDLGMAVEDLTSQGWTVVDQEGEGSSCHMVNSMGTLFRLVEDPHAYDEDE
jgi:hypothetical protein